MMDFLKEQGAFMLASRLRRLAERMTQDIGQIYQQHNIQLEPRHCSILLVMQDQACVTTSQIAGILGITVPAVSQLVSEMKASGLMTETACNEDKRKRWLTLTEKGQTVLTELQPAWGVLRDVMNRMVTEVHPDFIGLLERFELALDKRSIATRFEAQLEQMPPHEAQKALA